MKNTIKLMLIDENKLTQIGLQSVLENLDDIQLLYIFESEDYALKMVKKGNIDIVIIDPNSTNINGLAVINKINEIDKNIKIIILTNDDKRETITKALSLGVYSYIFKDINTDILVPIIRSVYQGSMWLAPKVVEYLRENNKIVFPHKQITRSEFKNTHSDLTQREYEVLKLIVEGKSNNDIANLLCISEHTAKAHVCNIIQKLVVDDRTQAAVKALKDGLV